jgi:hypothetical protein
MNPTGKEKEMKAKFDVVLNHCIEVGVSRGLCRSTKHTDEPTEAQQIDAIVGSIWDEIYEWFDNVHEVKE